MAAIRLSLADAERLLARIFVAHRTSAANAAIVARALVAAEADGLKGHGLSRVSTYAAQARAGKIDGFATPRAARLAPSLLSVDAAHGFAYPAIELAVSLLPQIAREQGLAAAAISRSHHCGVAGHPVERLAEQGFMALMLANTPAAIAPWGGRRALFGTNPIAFAAPVLGGAPIVVDLSLSKVARGNILAAKQKGEAIPEGWALDAEGRPTTDPAAALHGTMVPLGEAKGAALALMVELLVAALTGARLAFEASSFLDAEGPPPGTGQLILAFSVPAFGEERSLALARAVTGEPGARLPGARRLALREAARRDGIPIPEALSASWTAGTG